MSENKKKSVLLQGNEACVVGAIRAGMNFYAGYPITPSSEIAEQSAIRLPKVGGRFIQMEDEIASMAAIIGASLTGAKAMTATSGPGFSLKQENLGYAAIAEIPCVVVSIMRMGPSTGLPTSPAQGDIMQAKWGTQGDHPTICLCPSSVKEMHDLTITAFNYAEKYRTPVLVMTDEVIAHMREGVEIEDDYEIFNRVKPDCGEDEYLAYKVNEGELVPAMASFGDGYRFHVTGLAHDETGFPSNSTANNDILVRRICDKVDDNADEIAIYENYLTEDAEVVMIAYGAVARTAMFTANQLRANGIKAGVCIPKTIWPFPEKGMWEAVKSAKNIIVPELNLGQLVLEVERLVAGKLPVHKISNVTGELFKTEELYRDVMAVINNG